VTLSVAITHRRGDFHLEARLRAPEGGVTVLFGPSGAGKSTLLAAVAGLITPKAGRIAFGDEVLLDTAAGIATPARDRRFGVVFQAPRLFPHLDVRGNLLYGHARQPEPASEGAFDELVALLGIGQLLKRRPASLSGGEAQRVALGRALLSNPRMLLLDEPLSALDAPRRDEVMALLERLRSERGVAMLYVTHRQEEIARLADHVVVVDAGRVVRAGPVEATLASVEAAEQLLDAPTTVIRARVTSHDEDYGLTDLVCDGGQLTVERVDLAIGAELRLGVRATDVTLARAEPTLVSANNVLKGQVTALRWAGESWADVELDCLGQPLLARITRRSAQRLGIAPGDELWALVKSTTLNR
jgi:molybdate transport system ATP-binding protein